MNRPLFLAMTTALVLCLCSPPSTAEAQGMVCGPNGCYSVGGGGYSGGFFGARFRTRTYAWPTYSTSYSASYGEPSGYSSGSAGGYGAMAYAQPSVTYVGYSAPSSYSSGYSRDTEGNLIAPDGGMVTALDGTPIGPNRYMAAKTGSATTTAATNGSASDGICNCPGCNCGEHVKALETQVAELQKDVQELTDRAPFYLPELPKESAKAKEPAKHTGGWQKALAERGKPLPSGPMVAMK